MVTERILGRSYLTQVVAKKSDVVEGESVTAVTVGDMMEDKEVAAAQDDDQD